MSITTMSFIISERSTSSENLWHDAIQDTFVEALSSLDTLRDETKMKYLADKDRKESRKQICDKMRKCCNKGMLF